MLDSLLLSPSLKASLTEATQRYHRNVAVAASYLEGRGIGEAAATGHLLGCVDDPIPGHERFAGWLSIPTITDAGTVAMKFRCIRDHDCKAESCQRYDAPAGQKTRLYNARVCAEGGDVGAVVEGEFKAIVCTHVLGIPAVSTNAGTWLDHWPRAMANFDRVLVIADNDDKTDGEGKIVNPGRKHAEKVQKTLQGAELVLPPLGVQLDDWVLRDGPEAVRRAVGL